MDGQRADERDAELWARLEEAERRLMLAIGEIERLKKNLAFVTQRLKDLLGTVR